MTVIESTLGSVRQQAAAAFYLAGQAKGEAEAASGLYGAMVDDLKGIREQQNLHTAILTGHSKILDGLATTVQEHTRTLEGHTQKLNVLTTTVDGHTGILEGHTNKLDEHTKKLDEHTMKLDEHGTKLDEILDIVRTLK
ncbi:hypothetical protein DQ384_28455 [Sphaerisporangium album]|uniref:Uncharacterized protein n=1 Tax=Sphaerisporangium album TaxID=509200 RepID=A0A367F8Y1_9ACTN|nr:hypothetical protein DQ384_28455 [Sphaerisporangium album]